MKRRKGRWYGGKKGQEVLIAKSGGKEADIGYMRGRKGEERSKY